MAATGVYPRSFQSGSPHSPSPSHQFDDPLVPVSPLRGVGARAQFMWSLGVPEDDVEFHDVYGLDDDALDMVPQPVLAVVLCFPDPPQVRFYIAKLNMLQEPDFGGN